jgi:hypothetical protein
MVWFCYSFATIFNKAGIDNFDGGEANCLASPRILVRPPCRTAEGKILCIPHPVAQLVEQRGKLKIQVVIEGIDY